MRTVNNPLGAINMLDDDDVVAIIEALENQRDYARQYADGMSGDDREARPGAYADQRESADHCDRLIKVFEAAMRGQASVRAEVTA